MFLGLQDPLPYEPPWAIPVGTRREWLNHGDLRVVYLYETEDSATFRYRVFNMVEALRSETELFVAASWFTRSEFQVDTGFLDQCDLLVICRTRYDATVAQVIERARARDLPVVFDIDDLIVDPSYIHCIMEALDVQTQHEPNWDYWYAYTGRLKATLDLCDAAITTTEPLRHRIEAATGGIPCAVLPNFLNRRQSEVSASLLERKHFGRNGRDGEITMAFLSGSPTHVRDFDVALPAIVRALDRHPALRLRVVGPIELDPTLQRLGDRISRIPFQDYLNLQRVVAECEFCVVPLDLNEFTECKSELKFFEAGAVKCPVIASPVPAFADAITDGVSGLLSASHEWHEKLEQAVLVAEAGAEEYEDMASAARDVALDRYSWDRQGPRIRQTLLGLTGDAPGRGGQGPAPL